MPRLETTHEAMRHYYRGRVFESTGEIAIAIEEYKKAIELGADYADVRNSMGRAYAKNGHFNEAQREFRNALQINPHYLEAQRNLFELETRMTIVQNEKERARPARKLPKIEQIIPAKMRIPSVLFYLFGGIALTSLIVLTIIFAPGFLSPGKIEDFFAPSENISGITMDGKTIWLCDWFKQEIYETQLVDGQLTIKKTYHTKNVFPVGIATGKNYLWTCDAWSKRINRHIYDDDLSVIATFQSPGNNPGSLCFDGKVLWSTDIDSQKIYKHNMQDMQLLTESSYRSPCAKTIGFFFDGKNYWSVDGSSQIIYKHNMDLLVTNQYRLNFANKKISAVCIDKKYVWFTFENEQRLVRYPKRKIIN